MKIREKDVKVKKKNELELGAGVVEEISICKIPLYIYFKRKSYESEYKVYNVSENTYKKLLTGNDIQEDREDFLGNMPIEQDEIIWLVEKQNHQKVFGKIGANSTKTGLLILWTITLFGICLAGIGLFKYSYCKKLIEREAAVEGEIYDYSTARLRGVRYAQGYYNIYVKYTVDGKKYKGYNGKTAIQPKKGDKITVFYDSENPDKIIVKEDMRDNAFYFLLYGSVIAVVGAVLLGNYYVTAKKNIVK